MTPSSLLDRFQTWLWTRTPRGRIEAAALTLSRYALALLRDLLDGELNLRAMSLVYTSLLSLVPFLAIAFSLLKAFGVHNSLEPVLMKFLTPFGDQAPLLAHEIIGFVDNIKVGVLGIVGVTMLLYTAVSLIYKVEASFNFLWQRAGAGGMPRRFGEYLALLLVGPVLVFAALGLTGSALNSSVAAQLRAIEPFGMTLLLLARLVPYALIVGMFSFVYGYIPAARVRTRAALIGGVTAGIAWQMASVAFARFASGTSNYNAIYSGFAIVIFLLLWLYVGWLILLCGCRISYYAQNPRQMIARGSLPVHGSREADWVSLAIVALVYQAFARGEPAPDCTTLRHRLGASDEVVAHSLRGLLDGGVLVERAGDDGLLPCRDAESISLGELWQRLRGPLPAWALGAPNAAGIDEALSALEIAAARGKAGQTLRQWLATLESPDPSRPPSKTANGEAVFARTDESALDESSSSGPRAPEYRSRQSS